MRKLKLSWILFKILKVSLPFFKMIRNIQQIIKDMIKGNWIIIWNRMKKWFLRKQARIRYEISLGFKKITGNADRTPTSVLPDDNQMGS